MGSVLLHIAHKAGGVDVMLADDEPVGRLMPDVLAAAGVAPDGAPWRLAPPRALLPPRSSAPARVGLAAKALLGTPFAQLRLTL